MNTALAPRSLTHAELESALAAVRIPAYPAVVAEVMREAQKDDPQVKVLSRIIASDVGMSAMAVKLANSPLLGGASPVKSVQQAVARLGTSNILNVVIAVALRNSTEGLPEDLMARFWARTSTLALATGVLARKHVGISPELAYTYALFHDEGHGFARPENSMAFNAVTELFLAKHLGGRYEPIGKDFEGSSIQVPFGAEGLSGVAEALKQEK